MKAVTNIFLYEGELKFFGPGPCRLMHGIERCGSLRAAAMEMDLSYNKALLMIKRVEEALGFSVTEKTIGGKGGGGSRLTPEAKAFLERFEAYREACKAVNQELYQKFYGTISRSDKR